MNDKETQYWLNTIRDANHCLRAVGTRAWFQLDREGDRYATLTTLHEAGQRFTVRSTYGHRFLVGRRRTIRFCHAVAESKVRGHFMLQIPSKFNRPGRQAKMVSRTTSVVLQMLEPATGEQFQQAVNVIDAKESRTTPRGTEPSHSRFLTNRPIKSGNDVERILRGYTQRWKDEELHRMWKSGACRIEESQLRSSDGMMKWAIIMVATAFRVERPSTFIGPHQ